MISPKRRRLVLTLFSALAIALIGYAAIQKFGPSAKVTERSELERLEQERNKLNQLLSAAHANQADLQSLLEGSDPKNPQSAKAAEDVGYLLNGLKQTCSDLESQLSEIDAKIKSQKGSTVDAEPSSPPR